MAGFNRRFLPRMAIPLPSDTPSARLFRAVNHKTTKLCYQSFLVVIIKSKLPQRLQSVARWGGSNSLSATIQTPLWSANVGSACRVLGDALLVCSEPSTKITLQTKIKTLHYEAVDERGVEPLKKKIDRIYARCPCAALAACPSLWGGAIPAIPRPPSIEKK